jgi:4'-phosphopantetheinyl transferase
MNTSLSRAQAFEWQQTPGKIKLEAGQVHIWKIYLDNVYSCKTSSVLSAEELQRSLRLVSPQKRARFQCARAALREILSLYLHLSPKSIQIYYGPFGKPFISSHDEKATFEFNISHADDLMLAAFTTCGPVGIDLENHQSIQAADRIIASYFSTQDQEVFTNIPDEKKEDAFLSAWVLKEAYGKASGSGLSAPPARSFITPFTQTKLPQQYYELSKEDGFHFLRLTPSADFSAAAVIQTPEKPQLLFWETFSEG